MKARVILVLLVIAGLPGCFSTRNTTLARQSGEGQVIYRLSEEQAFNIVLDAFAEVMPSQSLFDITGPRRGYQATYRVVLSTYSQEVLVIPAIGTDAKGLEARGYWFDVSGSGSAGLTGSAKNRALYSRLREALDATGTAVVVTNLRDGQYETDGHAYRAGGRNASEVAAPGSRRPSGKPAD